MSRTVQIREIDDDTYAALRKLASDAGLSVSELLRREAEKFARRPAMNDWLEQTRTRPSTISRSAILETLDDLRGDWPAADH
ncbi:MAG: ribbon-helix-helix protein, CopG family [Microthrixaceae bacterium]|nr:ribbon-helix-helix protein, CopG family [Microthrixaceae bacterium]